MNNTLRASLFLTFALAACSGEQNQQEQKTSDALSAPGGDQCATVNDQAFNDFRALIEEAIALMEQDEAANAATGAYGAAATYSKDGFIEGLRILDENVDWLHGWASDGDPNATNYVEGYSIGLTMWSVSDQLQYAAHWASISAVYHTSYEARDAMELAFLAIEVSNDIRARADRCYVDAYFP